MPNRRSHHLVARGNERKHARAPFSAVRASWKLNVDGFSSSRGALHDAHHQKAPNAKNPAAVRRRRAWWRFRWLPGLASLTGCKPKETHYLSASACQDVRNSARSHNKPEKPPQNRTPQDSKRNLEIQRNCKVFDLENYQKTRKSPSFVHFNGSKAIPERFDFAGVSPVSYGCAPNYGRPERKDSAWTILQLHRIAFEQCRKPLSLRNQPLLPSHLNASAIPCGDFLSRFKNFGSKGNQARTQKQQKSNENAAISLLFCCFCVLA